LLIVFRPPFVSTTKVWRCDGDEGNNRTTPEHVHRHAKGVMATMGGIDTAASLDFFKAHGGYCDCEILLNVVRD
jgi:hypothetical protein